MSRIYACLLRLSARLRARTMSGPQGQKYLIHHAPVLKGNTQRTHRVAHGVIPVRTLILVSSGSTVSRDVDKSWTFIPVLDVHDLCVTLVDVTLCVIRVFHLRTGPVMSWVRCP